MFVGLHKCPELVEPRNAASFCDCIRWGQRFQKKLSETREAVFGVLCFSLS